MSTSVVEVEVLEILDHFKLAHVLTAEGRVYGITPETPGVSYDELRPGQRLRCEVTRRLPRVVLAELLE